MLSIPPANVEKTLTYQAVRSWGQKDELELKKQRDHVPKKGHPGLALTRGLGDAPLPPPWLSLLDTPACPCSPQYLDPQPLPKSGAARIHSRKEDPLCWAALQQLLSARHLSAPQLLLVLRLGTATRTPTPSSDVQGMPGQTAARVTRASR